MIQTGVRGRRLAIDAAVVLAVFLSTWFVGYRYLAASQVKTIVEWELGPAVMVACGHGFTRPDVESAALLAFLLRQRESITCAEVDGVVADPPLPVAQGERYAISLAGLGLRFGSLSWTTLDAYSGALFAGTMVLAYALFRQVVGQVLALCGVVMLVWSSQVVALLSFRDFGKMPAFFALWLVLAGLVRQSDRTPPLWRVLSAGAAGVLLGLGLGFRVDVLVCLPVFLAVLTIVVPGYTRRAAAMKALTVVVFLLGFYGAGRPVLNSLSKGSNSSHVVVLGMLTPFTHELGLETPGYDIGETYSDGFAQALITSHAQVTGNISTIAFGSPEYDAAGGELLWDLARQFPADMLIRPLAAVAEVLAAPFGFEARQGYLEVAPFNLTEPFRAVGRARDGMLQLFDGHVGWLAAFVLVVVSYRDPRLGLFGAGVILYFCGYSMLQFSRRHISHLDLAGIGLLLIAVQLVVQFAGRFVKVRATDIPPPVRAPAGWQGVSGVLAVAAGAVIILGVLLGLRAWQQPHVIGLIERTLGADWADPGVTPEPLRNSLMAGERPRLSWQRLDAEAPGLWRTGVLFRVPLPFERGQSPGPNDLRLEYMKVEFDARCGAGPVPIALSYTGAQETLFQEYIRKFEVPVSPGGDSTLLVPVYYHDGSGWRTDFDGFAVPEKYTSCVTAIRRARQARAAAFPLLNVVLTSDWRTRPWYQRRRESLRP